MPYLPLVILVILTQLTLSSAFSCQEEHNCVNLSGICDDPNHVVQMGLNEYSEKIVFVWHGSVDSPVASCSIDPGGQDYFMTIRGLNTPKEESIAYE